MPRFFCHTDWFAVPPIPLFAALESHVKNRWYQRFSIGGVTLFFAATALLLHGNKTESPGMFLASGIFLALAYVLSPPSA